MQFRIQLRTASAKDKAPEDLVQSYKNWNEWSRTIQADNATELVRLESFFLPSR